MQAASPLQPFLHARSVAHAPLAVHACAWAKQWAPGTTAPVAHVLHDAAGADSMPIAHVHRSTIGVDASLPDPRPPARLSRMVRVLVGDGSELVGVAAAPEGERRHRQQEPHRGNEEARRQAHARNSRAPRRHPRAFSTTRPYLPGSMRETPATRARSPAGVSSPSSSSPPCCSSRSGSRGRPWCPCRR